MISYARLATVSAWMLAITLALACLAALVLHLEHAVGSNAELLDPDAYSRLFTLHGAFGIVGVLRPGMLAPLGFAHVARSRPDGGRNFGLWPAGMGMLALVLALGIMIPVASGAVPDEALARSLSAAMFRLLLLADIGVGLGVLLGLVDIDGPGRSMLDWIVGAVALTEVVLASVELLVTIAHRDVFAWRSNLSLMLALLVGLTVGSPTANAPKPALRSARVAVALLLATAVLDLLVRAVAADPGSAFSWLRFPVVLVGQLAVMSALLRSGVRGPIRDVVLVLGLLMLPAMLTRLYVDALTIVHLADSYLLVADFHFDVLLIIALGGPLALRHDCPQRYERWPSVLTRSVPWVTGGALLSFVLALGGLGFSGMPRRYYAFLPEYLLGHRLAAVAATLLCLAMLAEAVLWIRGRPR